MVRMMQQAIENRGGQHLVTEDLAPARVAAFDPLSTRKGKVKTKSVIPEQNLAFAPFVIRG